VDLFLLLGRHVRVDPGDDRRTTQHLIRPHRTPQALEPGGALPLRILPVSHQGVRAEPRP
jgi:hypothetical protein